MCFASLGEPHLFSQKTWQKTWQKPQIYGGSSLAHEYLNFLVSWFAQTHINIQ